MHRSGTSAVAELLIAGGLDGGPTATLMPASSFNRRGFFEQLPIVELNDRILAHAGAHWLVPPTDSGRVRQLAAGDLGAEARSLLDELRVGDTELVLKDPRFSLTLPFWTEVLGQELRGVVLVYREPAEVAASLQNRDGMSLELGLHLWRAYTTSFLVASQDIEIYPVAFENLLQNPHVAATALAESLPDFSLDLALSQSSIEPQLRNQIAAGDALDEHTTAVLALIEQLPARTSDLGSEHDPQTWPGEISVEAASLLIAMHQGDLAERDEARVALDERVVLLEAERDQARVALDERVVLLEAERDQARAVLDERVVLLEGERDQARAALDAALEAQAVVLEASQQKIDEAHGVIITTTARLEGERDHAREAHRLTGQELATVRRQLSDYQGSRAAGIARRLWAEKRRARQLKARVRSRLPFLAPTSTASATVDEPPHTVVPDPVEFPSFDAPMVSIVIPVYGHLATTAACLVSIANTPTSVPYEVIVIDDCSPDNSAEWLAKCPNLRLVRNETNLGYLRSTNAGVAASSAPYVCLLNNDTTVSAGWIEALLRVIDHDDSVGAVGAKLVYPTGVLQEAGAIIFDDASGWNFGRNGDPEAPEVNFVREVDYCSAACLLVRRTCWDAVGGFDERFVPAYYEDTDLAFELRAQGWRVMYQPTAVITHYEGVSHGTDESQGLKAHQVRNKDNFVDKWAEVLASHPAPGSSPRRASWRGQGKRVLVVDHEVPAPDQDAGSLRMATILELLVERGYKVSILPHNRYRREPYSTQLAADGIEVLHGHISVEAYLEELRGDFAFAVVSRPDVATDYLPLIRKVLPDLPIAYDMVDFHGLRMQRSAEISGDERELHDAEQTTKTELGLARSADVVIAVTEEEASLIRDLVPHTETAVIPTIHVSPRSSAAFADRNGVMFIGSYRHDPNRDAINWLIDEVLPEIWKLDSAIGFHLVGSDLPDDLVMNRDPRIIVHGWLPHLDDIFNQVRLNIAPLRFGAGIKGKVGDSLARGVPVVTTDIGAEGFGPVAEILSVGQTATDLAKLTVALHNDEPRWTSQADRGVELIEAHFGYEPTRQSLSELIGILNG